MIYTAKARNRGCPMLPVGDNVVYYIEGLALNGLVRAFERRECGGNKAEIVVETHSGEKISTGCVDDKVSKNIAVILSLYAKWGRKVSSPSEGEATAGRLP